MARDFPYEAKIVSSGRRQNQPYRQLCGESSLSNGLEPKLELLRFRLGLVARGSWLVARGSWLVARGSWLLARLVPSPILESCERCALGTLRKRVGT